MANILRTKNNQSLEGALLKVFSNRRMHIRHEFEKEIQYVLHDNSERCFNGIIIDISDSGFGLFVFTPLYEGQEITITSDDKSLNRRGIVRRCHAMGDSIYKVGMEFLVR